MKELLKEKKNFILLAYPLALLLVILAKYVPGFAEYVWARGCYRMFRFVIASVTGLLPFSLGEIVVIILGPTILFFLIRSVVRAVKRRKDHKALLTLMRTLRNFLIAVGLALLAFTVNAGCNYYRDSIGVSLDLTVGDNNTEDLKNMCITLAGKAALARTELEDKRISTWYDEPYGTEYKKVPVEEYENTIRTVPFESMYSNSERAQAAREAMKNLASEIDALWGAYPKPKSVMLSRLMSRFGITGIFFPFTVEANINVDTPDYTKGFVSCHELAHIGGFMREDEANFIAFLVCRTSGDEELTYSGYMYAFEMAYNKLYKISKEACEEVKEYVTQGMSADSHGDNEYWNEFREKELYKAGNTINDTYLKLNSQEDGTKSYGRMLDLLMALYRKDGDL